jgi:hypothetical protein
MGTRMAQLFAPHYHTILDTNGAPVSGGYVRFYLTGTTTLATVYADSALTTPLGSTINGATGVQADSAGRLPAIYLNPAVAYGIKEYDAANGLIRATDPINDSLAASLAGASGSAGVGFTQSGASAVQTDVEKKLKNVIALTDWLTDAERADVLAGTNAIDITSKITACINDARPGAIIDATMLRGTVTLTSDPFASLRNPAVTFMTGRVTFQKDFNNGPILLPSLFHWQCSGTTIQPTTTITSILTDQSPASSLVGTQCIAGTATGTSGTNTITVSSASGFNVGAYISIMGVRQETLIQHLTDAAMTASTPASFGFTTSVANTIEGSAVYLLVDSEIILGTVSGGLFTVTQRGALGTTAASHLINATATVMRGYVDRITAVTGTTITLRSNLPRSFTSAPFRVGTLDTRISGTLTIDAGYDRVAAVSIFSCLSSTLSSNFYVSGNVKLKNASHGGLILFSALNAKIDIDSTDFIGKPATSTGASVWLFGECLRCEVKVRLCTDGYLGVAVDNKSSGMSGYGLDGSAIQNRVEIGFITSHSAGIQISGCRSNCVTVKSMDASTTNVIIDDGTPQTTTAPTTTGNNVIVESVTNNHALNVIAGNSVLIHSQRLTGEITLGAPLACAAGATTNSSTATLTGLVAGQTGRILSMPSAGLPTGVVGRAFASATNTFRLEFTNANAGSQNAPAGDYVVRFEGDF